MSVEKIMKKVRRKIGKYEVGRTIGEGTFAKVKFAKHTETGESVAIKVMAKTTILKHRMVEQVSPFFPFQSYQRNI
jgi:5'-AMP-activated protein kinase catalytic alpha subunit